MQKDMMRPWNFSAGPAVLPLEVLQQVAHELTDWQGTGMSVMEMSHRGPHFKKIITQAEQDFRQLLSVPDDFAVLFTQGGAQSQNALVPFNLLGRSSEQTADYVVSGRWSEKSFAEAQRYGTMRQAASSNSSTIIDGQEYAPYTWFPEPSTWDINEQAAYVHVCSNETVGGVEFTDWPDIDVPIVVDASSDILSQPINFDWVDVVYAGAQKIICPAGLTLVLVRKSLLGYSLPTCPAALNYTLLVEQGSMVNTPPTFAIYVAGLVFKWLQQQGGVAEIERRNKEKAQLLYETIDRSGFYANSVAPSVRSRMNIPFQLHDSQLDELFLKEAAEAGLLQLKGHKSVGGMRASIYNAMPLEGVQALVQFMQRFEEKYG